MIGRLSGTLVERRLDGTCILDVGGVGYEVSVPVRAWDALPTPGEGVTVHVHTHVREDALALYGFPTYEDREAFRALLSVSKIGPKVANAILGRLSANELAVAITRSDKAAFKKIPGVGAKTVERMLIDLKDKLRPVGGITPSTQSTPARTTKASDFSDDLEAVIQALVHMGYKRAEAERAAKKVEEEASDKPVEILLREALKAIA